MRYHFIPIRVTATAVGDIGNGILLAEMELFIFFLESILATSISIKKYVSLQFCNSNYCDYPIEIWTTYVKNMYMYIYMVTHIYGHLLQHS